MYGLVEKMLLLFQGDRKTNLPLKQEKKSAFEIRGEKKYVLINDLCC
jgi:hypothetical protein